MSMGIISDAHPEYEYKSDGIKKEVHVSWPVMMALDQCERHHGVFMRLVSHLFAICVFFSLL